MQAAPKYPPPDASPSQSTAVSDVGDTNSSLHYTEEDVVAMITLSSVLGNHMKLEDWVDDGLHGTPPEIASKELEIENASALFTEH